MPKKQPTAVILAPYLGFKREVTREILKGKTSNASDKLQVKPALRSLRKLGYETKAISLNTDFKIRDIDELNHPEICIVSKLRSHPSEDSDIYAMFHQSCVLNLKRKGTKIVTLYSDNLAIKNNPDGELYRNILFLSDAIISPSSTLIGYARKWVQPNTFMAVVKDPCLIPELPFKQLSSINICKVLWFGNNSNIKYLRTTLLHLLSNAPRQRRFQFTFLASADGLKEIEILLSKSDALPCWNFRLVTWDHNNQPNQLIEELNNTHITLIPSDPSDPRKSGVSHNRLTDSIQSGCIAVASPMNSYLELARVSLIGENLSQLFNKAVNEHSRLCAKYNLLRREYLKPFQPQNNEKAWDKIIRSIQSIE